LFKGALTPAVIGDCGGLSAAVISEHARIVRSSLALVEARMGNVHDEALVVISALASSLALTACRDVALGDGTRRRVRKRQKVEGRAVASEWDDDASDVSAGVRG
jgi:hypothetical protein